MNDTDVKDGQGAPDEEISKLTDRISLLEQQLRQAQQMEALGALAGGIAHDFNNILSAIIGFSDLARDDLPEEGMARANIDQVLSAGYRAKELVTQILTFSRQTEQAPQPLQMHLIIKETLRLLRATLPSTIDIRHSIDKHCGAVRADPAQIYQIIMNLCTNAYQAMQKRGGILDVSLAGIEVDEELAATNENLHTGRYVSLTVHDTGHGMDPETRAQIFNPDFTTKENGQGTGLGLPIVRNIVSNHGGAISVHSEPGKGATFTIYLPRFEMPSESADQEEIGRPPQQYRIMFVDDEETVGEVVRQMLKRLGHEAVILNSSAKALEMFSNDPQGFDLIITDEIMPNLTGSELAGEFLRLRPDIPVVLTTGFVEPTSPEHLKEAGFQACMMKPFSTSDLFKIIDGVFSDPENPDKT